jgi:hypothetical protein
VRVLGLLREFGQQGRNLQVVVIAMLTESMGVWRMER